jgi:hypothetical protein
MLSWLRFIGLGPPCLTAEAFEVDDLLLAPVPSLAQDLNAYIDTFVTDMNVRSSDEPFDLMLALAAEGAVQFARLRHGWLMLGPGPLKRSKQ